MEDIHGVDVSWLHHSSRDHHHRQQAPALPAPPNESPPRSAAPLPVERAPEESRKPQSAPSSQQSQWPSTPPATPPASKAPIKRPALLGRVSADKTGTSPSRRNSWMQSLSSKFSSQNSPGLGTQSQAQVSAATVNGVHGTTSSANGALNGIQAASGGSPAESGPYVPQAPKGSFISNALRRLSSGSQVGTLGKATPHGGVCARRVLNIDPNRNRCLVPELDDNKLRRVAFCVDVEIAGGPKYKDDLETEERKKKRKDKKLKERGEGEALKNPDLVAEEKDKEGIISEEFVCEVGGAEATPNSEGNVQDDEGKEPNKKKEKKKRSEAERKERKEKKRLKAVENGSVPLELSRDDDESGHSDVPITVGVTNPHPHPQDLPTTDPVRIYRRCCQLRETPILKRICDQLSAPSACSELSPGVVACLDLTGSRLQLADVVTLSDWLAVVPVKKLFLEDADLNDEKVRVILAGLLAAKIPEPTRRRSPTLEKDAKNRRVKVGDRSGVIKKLVLKNNPKIAAEGWRHISLFVYLCKSIMALDVSMIPFPKPGPLLSPQTTNSSQTSTTAKESSTKDMADVMSKAISERLGGSILEELVMGECSLSSSSLRKFVDGAVISGVQRLGLAGNDIDEEGLDHVIHYIRSGVCQGVDLGGNDLRFAVGRLSECFTKSCHLWAISLADCDLTPESLKILLPALVTLPAFRFLDLSHNRELFSHQNSLCLLRKYIPHFKELKRLHLMDVSLSPKDAIGLAEVFPECTHLAHVNILENPQISILATATDEETQEEAAALYASLTVAAKVSRTLICVDVDVPAPESNEVVKALAKQVVAYCLRNMENHSEIPELKAAPKEVEVAEVLMHLVGHTDDSNLNYDSDPPAPDDDYIVGGTGVAKALSYCLSSKATDLRQLSLPASGTVTPRGRTEDFQDSGKAMAMSKTLLENARNIRQRLQPALFREARSGNDMAYRRLLFLDQTLQGMVQRFEDEYPETRVPATDVTSTHSSIPSPSLPSSSIPTLSTSMTEPGGQESDEDEPRPLQSRHNSDVSLASRALSLEEGRLHRLGHRVRTEVYNASRPSSSHSDQAAYVSGTMDHYGLPDHLLALREQFFTYSGAEIRDMTENLGWERAFDRIIENAEELKRLEKESPDDFARFRESQIAALKNRDPGLFLGRPGEERKDDVAVGD
ncbi:hypothetical protein BDV95DRAFT_550732 [Massariosphaeria phaeospora]|uniref:RNI-like protein n=1 Tax=Massariosphaeria phaeospora TaxID=100035 RepID=A0A7C8I5E3_9PLEO|nr:hypothetical protein BDV95DRAFT_550732 [Massariosphaeria phaeospora]